MCPSSSVVEDFLNASFNELVRRWGAVKRDTYYEVAALRAPWVLAAPFRASLKAGARYELRGISISLGGRGEAYVVLTNGEVGYGFIYAEGRRRMFRCIRRPYAAPYSVKLPPHIKIRPLQLSLSDSGLVDCVDGYLEAEALAVLPSSYSAYRRMKVEFASPALFEVG